MHVTCCNIDGIPSGWEGFFASVFSDPLCELLGKHGLKIGRQTVINVRRASEASEGHTLLCNRLTKYINIVVIKHNDALS